ncbi:bromodomain adjacent to zinc finger domain protein 1A isoform X2 [Venturia canescens]|uniref:bromodomain adjacent to zinc finger domain protein 1A isoform X2 n=1 Tax=Venturia canescens TaxID=32260 RepID=UPI001C9C3310|nr:bromodomain adjacent to zinc finger domain protein 1A isoform X2 [Venturia canescens]
MPYLRKKPFQRLHVSSDYKDDDEVFHCEVTNEVFKDYNEFCERIILCNSTIWSCSITGKTNMTFEEALVCEENAKKSLKEFPMELRIPILYLANRTCRTSFNEMIEDVYQFARDRFFVGEMVEASFTEDSWCECHVLQVIEPTEAQIEAYVPEANRNPQDRHYHPPAKLFRYEVEQLDCGDSDVSQLMIVEAAQVRRRKQQYSRERNKIFLRLLCELNSNGIWVIKESVQQKYGIAKVRFDTIFAGPLPDFTPQPKKIIKQKQETLDKFLTADTTKHRQFEKPDPLRKLNETSIVVKKFRKPRTNGRVKEDLKARALENKAKRQEQRNENRERKKEEKQKLAALAAYVREWNKPREDLECEDLRPLHEPTAIKCGVPNESFGDFAMILEFLQFFKEELEVSTYFPNGINLDILERAMMVKETSGSWSELLQLLLANIFKYQAEEEDEIHADDGGDDVNMEHGVSSMAEAVKLATMASSWCQNQQGCQLSEITLDHVTLSEILRQHLLSSGGRISEAASKWRYSQRGGYTNHDDPALQLRMNEARILRTLGHRSVCEFDLADRLTLTICLINQLLTFASIRDVIEERHEKVHQARRELKLFLLAEQKKEREEKEKMKEREKDGNKVEPDLEQEPKKVTRGNRGEEKKREDYENKLTELRQASKDDQMMLYLGSDRSHRRYWRFLSIPGLFVENDEWWPGTCLRDGTPYLPELQDGDATYTYLRNKFEDELSDKENSVNKASKSPKKGGTADKNGIKSPRKESKQDFNEIRRKLMCCTGNAECPVHRKRAEPKWSFYGIREDLEAVINGLNKRGIREGELKNNLIHETDSLISVIENCPKYKLNPELFGPPPKDTTAKTSKKSNKNENFNLNFPADMAIDDVMELTLRDSILDLEEKLSAGCLGSLKVKDRDAWRDAITNGKYDKQCDKLVYGPHESEVDLPFNSTLDKIKSESRNSRPGTPDSEVGSAIGKVYRDPGKYLGPPGENDITPDPKQQTSIRQMACAILQLSNAVEPKFLKKPSGADDKDKVSIEESRERWEQSLMASTSWSQLFVHLNTLENKVAWGKSVTHARCRVCRRRKNAEIMLLCDGCNKGHHLYCLKPKLTTVPEGDWFCSSCKPRETKPKEKIKKRKKFEDESEEETVILTKETRHNRAKRVPDSDCGDVENGDEDGDDDDKEEDTDAGSKAEPVCTSCRGNGRLVSCDSCPQRFHIDCLEPPLVRIPRGKWTCHDCRNPRKHSSRIVRGRERERDNERLSAAAARSRIHGFVKTLLTTDSADWDAGSASEETTARQTRRTTKRAAFEEKSTTTQLKELLADVMKHVDSWPFLTPVTIDEVPDYYDYIKNPMDFGTIKTKLESGKYGNVKEFVTDCQLVFENCDTYNQEHSVVYNFVHRAGMRLSAYFEKKCKALGLTVEEEIDQAEEQPPEKKPRLASNGLHEEEEESDEEEDNEGNDAEMEVDEDEDEEDEDEEENEEAEDDNDSTYGS